MSTELKSDRVALVSLNDPELIAQLESLAVHDLHTSAGIVVDFSAVQHINSSGIAQLLRVRKRLIEEDRKLVLCGMSSQVMSVFEVTGLDKIFILAGDHEKAMALARS